MQIKIRMLGISGQQLLIYVWLSVCLVINCGYVHAQETRAAFPPVLEVAIGLDAALTVSEVAALPRERFVPYAPRVTHPISIDKPLWLRMQSDPRPTRSSAWFLEIPTVIVDRYEVYQRDAAGVWQMAAAGDRVAHTQWPERSSRPRFLLPTSELEWQEVYIRVVHQLPATIQPLVVDAATAEQRDANNMLWAGLLAGVMSALLLICLQMSLSYRDWTYLWYAAYLLATTMAAMAYSGVGQQFLWPTATKFASDAVVYFVLSAFSFNLLFVNGMFGKWLGNTYRWITKVLISACLAYMVLTIFIVNYASAIMFFMAITIAVSAFILLTAVQAWRKAVPYSGYWLLVYIPYLLSIALVVAESSGQITLPWLPVNTPMLSAMVEAIAMMFCLNAYSRESHAQAVREQVAAQRDPLTGFLNESRFVDLAHRAWRRASSTRRDISMAYVLVECKEPDLSTVQLEALMLRSVRLVRTAMRENDGLGRIGHNMLGIAMPDVKPGEDLTARLSRLVALGLTLDPQDSQAYALKFTLAVASWRINSEEFRTVDQRLRALLVKDSQEQERTIRFLEPH
jgi:GGDEF domain-containing protein